MASVWGELKRRNVVRVAIAYAVVAWLSIEVSATTFPMLKLPEWAATFVTVLLIIGFPVAVIFAWAYEFTPEGLKKEKDVDRSESITHITGRKIDFVIIGVLVVAVGFLLVDKLYLGEGETAPDEVIATERKSIAVLPFDNMSDDPGNEYFSDGISEDILNLLVKVPELRVTSRSSAFSFKGQNVDIPTIAAKLNVAHVLEGSVRKSGNQLRITAQLIEVVTDTHIWSETYDRELISVFAIQDEIAAAVVDALKISLLGDIPRVQETTPEAYALYLQSRWLAVQRTTDSMLQAEALIKRALEMDDEYSPAWARLARIYVIGAGIGSWNPNEVYPMARTAAMAALRLDANNAIAHAALSRIARVYDYDMETARKEQQLASTSAPGDNTIRASAALLALNSGDFDETIRLGEEAALGDPVNLQTKMVLGYGYLYTGRIDEAMSVYREVIALNPLVDPVQLRLGQALLISGDFDAALEAMNKAMRDGMRVSGRALVFQAMGDSERAAAELDDLIALGYTWTYEIAMVHAYRGELDEAFTWLGRAIDRHDMGLGLILGDPFVDNLRDDPRFDAVLERLGRKAP